MYVSVLKTYGHKWALCQTAVYLRPLSRCWEISTIGRPGRGCGCKQSGSGAPTAVKDHARDRACRRLPVRVHPGPRRPLEVAEGRVLVHQPPGEEQRAVDRVGGPDWRPGRPRFEKPLDIALHGGGRQGSLFLRAQPDQELLELLDEQSGVPGPPPPPAAAAATATATATATAAAGATPVAGLRHIHEVAGGWQVTFRQPAPPPRLREARAACAANDAWQLPAAAHADSELLCRAAGTVTTGFWNDPVFQDLGTGKTMFHIDPNLYLVLNRHSLMLVYFF